jgi:hypothetical protein
VGLDFWTSGLVLGIPGYRVCCDSARYHHECGAHLRSPSRLLGRPYLWWLDIPDEGYHYCYSAWRRGADLVARRVLERKDQ